MKILIVEDEKLLADSLKSILEKKGFDVEVAAYIAEKLSPEDVIDSTAQENKKKVAEAIAKGIISGVK